MPKSRCIFWDGMNWREAKKIRTLVPGAVYEPGTDSPVVNPAPGDAFCLPLSAPGSTDALPEGLRFGEWIEPGHLREIV